MATLQQVREIAGVKNDVEFREDGKWLVTDQTGSKGICEGRVAKLKAAGIPAFYSARERVWGVLAEKIEG